MRPSEKSGRAICRQWQDKTLLAVFKTLPEVQATLADFDDEEVMQAIRTATGQEARLSERSSSPNSSSSPAASQSSARTSTTVCSMRKSIPEQRWKTELTKDLERVVIVHRLREVTALVGYTRFDYISPDIDGEFDLNLRPARLGVNTNWIPAIENKGEGLFLQFSKDAWIEWKQRPAVKEQAKNLERGLHSGAWNKTSNPEISSAPLTSCFTRCRTS